MRKDLNNGMLKVMARIKKVLENGKKDYPNEFRQLCDYYTLDLNDIDGLTKIIYRRVVEIANQTSLDLDEVAESVCDLIFNFPVWMLFNEYYLYLNQNL